ncbi:M15 family metallopeptidase [Kytococcus sedentarius]|uniref:M15 family metallopeptidase n=1 Tax=Kytococcus sedentarius TaxID=1276 RepID=UPI00194EA498|nr:M15 family metallopeptidase [Kytococcus sedentarius]QRO86646.1 D-alanyl-D-alanine carboxypeptidase family protein [Kytococcus sedentarius]
MMSTRWGTRGVVRAGVLLAAGLALGGCAGDAMVDRSPPPPSGPSNSSSPSSPSGTPSSDGVSPPPSDGTSAPSADEAPAPSQGDGDAPAPQPSQDAAPNPRPGEGGARFQGPYLHPESITPRPVTEVGPHTIVNRANALPEGWEPEELVVVEGAAKQGAEMRLVPEASRAWDELRAAAAADGIDLRLNAAYRSFAEQERTWEYFKEQDPDHLMVYVAAPGRSEHQMGLAIDIADMPTYPQPVTDNERGQWLVEHAAEHGWVLRYPQGRQAETGYRYEAWHWRWVGKDLAQHLAANDLTMEQWAGLVR